MIQYLACLYLCSYSMLISKTLVHCNCSDGYFAIISLFFVIHHNPRNHCGLEYRFLVVIHLGQRHDGKEPRQGHVWRLKQRGASTPPKAPSSCVFVIARGGGVSHHPADINQIVVITPGLSMPDPLGGGYCRVGSGAIMHLDR